MISNKFLLWTQYKALSRKRARVKMLNLIRNGLNELNGLNVLNLQSRMTFVTLRVDPPSGVLCPHT